MNSHQTRNHSGCNPRHGYLVWRTYFIDVPDSLAQQASTMSNKVSGLNDKAFELAFRLFEEYRSRRERHEQYLIEQRHSIEDSRPALPPAEVGPEAPDEEVYALEDILSTFDDEDKRREFEAFIDLLPVMVEERHGLCTGLDSKTIDDALTKDITSKDVAKYIADNAAREVKDVVVNAASSVANTVSALVGLATAVAGSYASRVYHGFFVSSHQTDVALSGKVDASPIELTLANANAQIAAGITVEAAAMGYLYYLRELIDGYAGQGGSLDPEKVAMVGILGSLIAGEGLVRRAIAKEAGEPCGSSIGTLMAIPGAVRKWYEEKKRELALKRLKMEDDEGCLILGDAADPKKTY